jgi:cysteine desulfurase
MEEVFEMHPALAGGPVCLDFNANTPIDPRVVDALLPAMTGDFGNPSSVHVFAEAPRPAARSGTRGRWPA